MCHIHPRVGVRMSPDHPAAVEMLRLYEMLTPDEQEAMTFVCIAAAIGQGHADALMAVIMKLRNYPGEPLQ